MFMALRRLVAVSALPAAILLMTGCPDSKKQGPLEATGEAIDDILDDAQEAVEDLGSDGPIEKLGEQVDEAAEEVKDAA